MLNKTQTVHLNVKNKQIMLWNKNPFMILKNGNSKLFSLSNDNINSASEKKAALCLLTFKKYFFNAVRHSRETLFAHISNMTATGKWVKYVEMSFIIFYHLLLFYSLIAVLMVVTKTNTSTQSFLCTWMFSLITVIFTSY